MIKLISWSFHRGFFNFHHRVFLMLFRIWHLRTVLLTHQIKKNPKFQLSIVFTTLKLCCTNPQQIIGISVSHCEGIIYWNFLIISQPNWKRSELNVFVQKRALLTEREQNQNCYLNLQYFALNLLYEVRIYLIHYKDKFNWYLRRCAGNSCF